MNPDLRPVDYTIRPFFRILGAVLLVCVAGIFVVQGLRLWGAASMVAEQCQAVRSRLWCEIGNWLLAATPQQLQGPLATLMHIGSAVLLAALAGGLLRPLLKRG